MAKKIHSNPKIIIVLYFFQFLMVSRWNFFISKKKLYIICTALTNLFVSVCFTFIQIFSKNSLAFSVWVTTVTSNDLLKMISFIHFHRHSLSNSGCSGSIVISTSFPLGIFSKVLNIFRKLSSFTKKIFILYKIYRKKKISCQNKQ